MLTSIYLFSFSVIFCHNDYHDKSYHLPLYK